MVAPSVDATANTNWEEEVSNEPKKLRKVYCLRTRVDDKSEWSEEEVFVRRKDRDTIAAECRIFGGIRTHTFERYEKGDGDATNPA